MSMTLSVFFRSALIAWDELSRELGAFKAMRVMGEVGRRNAIGRPWKGLPPTQDARDQATRDELTPAVNLFDVLKESMGEEDAYQVARRVILNSSLLHLRSIYPAFKGGDFLALADGDAEKAATRLGADFAFADTRAVEMTPERAAFDVTHCRIPHTLALVGAQRLAPIFCEVDFIYFPIFEPGVRLEREKTIIQGGDVCDFRFSWKK